MNIYRDEEFLKAISKAQVALKEAIAVVAYDNIELTPWKCGLVVTVKIDTQYDSGKLDYGIRYRIGVVETLQGVAFRRDCKTVDDAIKLMDVRLSELTRNVGMSTAVPLKLSDKNCCDGGVNESDVPPSDKIYGYRLHFGEAIIEVEFKYHPELDKFKNGNDKIDSIGE